MIVSTLAMAAALAHPDAICGPACTPVEAPSVLAGAPAVLANSSILQAQARPETEPPEEIDEDASDPAVQPTAPDSEIDESDSSTIVVTGDIGPPSEDPVEELNVAAYEVVQELDEILVEPIAEVYDEALPKPIRSGLRNFISNIAEPVNFLNFLLQFKIGKALKSAARFAINTTVGVGGLFEVASKKPFSLELETNGFANTLGFYGIGPGPYLYLPLIGSTTVRDLFGRVVDVSVLPAIAGPPFNKPIYTIPIATLTSLETRIRTDEQVDAIREKCGDPYSATRDFYLIQRQLEIDGLRGRASDDLAELIDRVEFNCDIDILIGESLGINAEQFINRNTNLVEDFEADAEAVRIDPAPDYIDSAEGGVVEGGTVEEETVEENTVEEDAEVIVLPAPEQADEQQSEPDVDAPEPQLLEAAA